MNLKMQRSTWMFIAAAVLIFAVVQVLIGARVLSDFWNTIIRIGAVMAIVSLGLNLIYGFNGQFSLGQWGFYAIGAYAAADVTYRWQQLHSASGLVILTLVVALAGVAFLLIGRLLSRVRGLDPLSAFALYLVGVLIAGALAVAIGQALIEPVTALLIQLPKEIALQIVFILAVLLAGALAAEVSFLFGLPVLALGSDYFGIATLGFTIIVKVLLDNSDTLLGFEEMKGARGMVGIPKITTWFWVALFLLIVVMITRNLLHSSTGRAIVSVREDETAGKTMGIDVARYKTLTFVLGSLFAGLAGGLYAHVNGFLHPDTFNFIKSFDPMIIVVFGGLGSVTGTVIASFTWALVLEGFLRLVLPEGFETWRFVVYPLLLLIMMLLRPKGLFGGFEVPFLKPVLPPLRKARPAEAQAELQPTAHGLPSAASGETARLQTNPNGNTRPVVLEVHRLTKLFGGLKAVLNFDLTIQRGELVGLIGPNGAGKTTVFNMITGVYVPSDGAICFKGADLIGLPPHQITQLGIGRTFQNIRLFPNLTVLDNVRIAYHPHAGYNLADAVLRTNRFEQRERELTEKAQDFLAVFNLQDRQDEIAKNLPYGEQRRLEIARALATEPQLLLLDEPAAGMNPKEAVVLMDLIHFIRDRFDLTILLIEHQMRVVMGVCERITVMDFGEVIARGKPEEIQANPQVIEAYLGRGAAALAQKLSEKRAHVA